MSKDYPNCLEDIEVGAFYEVHKGIVYRAQDSSVLRRDSETFKLVRPELKKGLMRERYHEAGSVHVYLSHEHPLFGIKRRVYQELRIIERISFTK